MEQLNNILGIVIKIVTFIAQWIQQNIGTICISIFLIVAVVFAFLLIVKNFINGKRSCDGECANCPRGGNCVENKQ